MDYKKIRKQVMLHKQELYKHLDENWESLYYDYYDGIQEDWIAEDEENKSEEAELRYINYYMKDAIENSFIPYMLETISIQCSISMNELSSLDTEKEDLLISEFVEYFSKLYKKKLYGESFMIHCSMCNDKFTSDEIIHFQSVKLCMRCINKTCEEIAME